MNNLQLTYREFQPHSHLFDYIKAYWYFKVQTNKAYACEILPDGYFDLLLSIKYNQVVGSRITGVWSKAVHIDYTEDTTVFGIRFKPFALGSLFKFKLKERLDSTSTFDLKDIGLSELLILDGLNHHPSALINNLNNHFITLLEDNQTNKRLKGVFEMVDLSCGTETVANISNKIGLSARQIQRNMVDLIGMGVKDYAKIVRFRKALKRTKFDKSDYYPYFDQSHFIRDVKSFTGQTPTKMDLNNDVRFIQYYDFIAL